MKDHEYKGGKSLEDLCVSMLMEASNGTAERQLPEGQMDEQKPDSHFRMPQMEEQKPDSWPPSQEEVQLVENVSEICARDQQRQLENAVVVYLITRTGDVEWLIERAMARAYKYFLKR
jgi:hypothetical protein